jgi:hypothetical protein
LKGTIGDITFYKIKDGHLARKKGGIDASRIASDLAFQRTRENGSEFGRAGKQGKLCERRYELYLSILPRQNGKSIDPVDGKSYLSGHGK